MNFLCNVWGLSVEEWLLGQSRDEQEFNSVYRPWLGRRDMAAQGKQAADQCHVGAGAGQLEANHYHDTQNLQGVGSA